MRNNEWICTLLSLIIVGSLAAAALNYKPTTEVTININPQLLYVEHDPKELVKKVFGDEWPMAWAVVMAENHGRPDAVGDKHLAYIGEDGKTYGCSVGLFQIQLHNDRPPADLLFDVYVNVMYAYNLRVKRGWGQWGSVTNGSYKKFLPVLTSTPLKKEV